MLNSIQVVRKDLGSRRNLKNLHTMRQINKTVGTENCFKEEPKSNCRDFRATYGNHSLIGATTNQPGPTQRVTVNLIKYLESKPF